MVKLSITGTFLDEITHDIPSSNWGVEEWRRDFDSMKSVGIDTVIIIRAGFKDKSIFNSESLQSERPMRPAYTDLLDLFLCEAERCQMDLYFGLYDSGNYWLQEEYQKEIDINRSFTDEVIEKYGNRKAFKGWYASHELYGYDESQLNIYYSLSEHLKGLKDIPILMSPYVRGRKQFDNPITAKEHEKQWDIIMSQLSGKVDYIAFQDGQIDFSELLTFMAINKELADKHRITSWSNVESFERGMPIDFLPISWGNLRYKMEIAQKVRMEKMITFEFSHFLSPNSIYPSAHNLFKQYNNWLHE